VLEARRPNSRRPLHVDLGALSRARDMEGARALLQQGATLASACKAERLVEIAVRIFARPERDLVGWFDGRGLSHTRGIARRAHGGRERHQRAIADELFVNVKTIEGHLSRAYRKLGVTSRFELAEVLGESPIDVADYSNDEIAPTWSEDR